MSELNQQQMEKLHSAVVAIDMQLEDIGRNHPEIFGQGLLAMLTFLLEKVHICSANADAAGALIASAMQAAEPQMLNGEDKSPIITLDDIEG